MRNMEIEKPGKFTRYKGKLVICQKGYEIHKIGRVWVKLEYGISCFAKRKESKDLNAKIKS